MSCFSACEKGGQWKKALGLLYEMNTAGEEPNAITYSAAIIACFNSSKYQEAVSLTAEAQSLGKLPLFSIESAVWDLHELTLPTACMAVSKGLLSLKQDNGSLRDIVVVTGKGKGSGEKGPVLKEGIPIFLSDNFGPLTTADAVNDGCFWLLGGSLEKWLASDDFKRFEERFS